MSRYISVKLDDATESKLRKLQSEKMIRETRNVSFLEIITEVLERGLEK